MKNTEAVLTGKLNLPLNTPHSFFFYLPLRERDYVESGIQDPTV